MNPNQIKRKDILCTSHWTDWTLYIILHLKVGHLISSLLPEEKCHARPEFSSQRKKILPLCGCDCFPIRLFNGELFHREDAQQLSSVWISLSLSLSLSVFLSTSLCLSHIQTHVHTNTYVGASWILSVMVAVVNTSFSRYCLITSWEGSR